MTARPLDGLVHLLSRHDREGNFLELSPEAAAVLGTPGDALLGRPLQALVEDADGPQIDRLLAGARDTRTAVSVVCRVRGAAARWIEICGHGVRHPGSDEVAEIHCVTRDRTAELQAREQAEVRARQLEALIDGVPGSVWATEAIGDSQQVVYVSSYCENLSGYPRETWFSRPTLALDIVHPDDRARYMAPENWTSLYTTGQVVQQNRWVRADGRVIWVESHIRAARDEHGAVVSMHGVTMDVTARKQAEEGQARAREEVLAELSTPLIPISGDVVVMPLIGEVDRPRAARVVQTLLQGIASLRTRTAILDITGVPSVDAETADMLLQAARGVRLLGAAVILTGIRPEVARMLITLGTDLTGITTHGTLEDGIRHATRRAS